MNWLDWVLVALLGISTVRGLFSGLVRGLFSLAGLALAVIVAGRFYPSLAQRLTFIAYEDLAKVMAFILIGVGVLAIALILGAIFRRIMVNLSIGWLDALGGAALGFSLGAVACGALLALAARYPVFNLNSTISQSWLASAIVVRFPLLRALLPPEFDALRSLFQ